MKPNLLRINQNSSASTSSKSLKQLSEDGGCPSETVPIKRITKDDLIRHRHMPPPENVPFDDQFVAGTNNISEPKERYMSSQGYKVDPILYGDFKTRLFIHFQASEVHCFNTLCPDFIQVDSEIPLDVSYEDHISQRGGTIWEDTMYIERDLVNGNWWLLLENDYTEIGFWPRKIFTHTGLAGFAKSINWGGVAYSPTDVPEPPMGSSFFPIENSGYDAYCKKIAVLDVKGKTIAVDKTITHIDNPNLYKVLFKPLWVGSKSSFYVLYGGPGESAQV
ncbi:hypothetical protein R3W88_021704 [Solanum pinnatisectum]|uniref:Neprosin PEP catalytic domain-containing protein n=1 Tax=Solanum pinnatisectum TaxID=50273 RepID=A0AAV9LSK9_9SOLN|nr:hypothetical protein R3W88_021704 [Solanum pinnatisectum]